MESHSTRGRSLSSRIDGTTLSTQGYSVSAIPARQSWDTFQLLKPFYFYFVFFCFLGPRPQHMEVPRLGVSSELQLPTYTTATATPDPSRICDLHHSSP